MTELFGKALDFISNKISMRKLMFWIIVFILLWVCTPSSWVAFVNARSFTFLPDNLLFATLCVAMSYLAVDFISSVINPFLEKRRKARIKLEALYEMEELSKDEMQIIGDFVMSGRNILEYEPDNEVILTLMAKKIISQAYQPKTSYSNPGYRLRSIYREIMLELLLANRNSEP